MIVCKFGGTSLANGEEIAARAEVIAARRGQECFVVASAMAMVSRELLQLGRRAAAGSEHEAATALDRLLDRHRDALVEARVSPGEASEVEAAIEAEGRKLGGLVRQVARERRFSPLVTDRMLAAGELLSSRLMAAVLRSREIPASWIDPRDLVATDESFGNANPDVEETSRRVRDRVLPLLSPERVVVTGGFIGRSRSGVTTTLGWGASDLSATLLGAVLEAPLVEIWTDVDGIATADPRLVSTARTLRRLSHEEAAELAYFGAEVLHHRAITPLVGTPTTLRVRNSFRPDDPGTLVAPRNGEVGLRGVSLTAPLRRDFLPASLSCPSQAANGDPAWGFQGKHRSYQLPTDEDGGTRVAVLTLVGHEVRRDASLGRRAVRILRAVAPAERTSSPCDSHLAFLVPEEGAATALCSLHDALCQEDRG